MKTKYVNQFNGAPGIYLGAAGRYEVSKDCVLRDGIRVGAIKRHDDAAAIISGCEFFAEKDVERAQAEHSALGHA